MEWILELDRGLFLAINGMHSPAGDAIMTFCSGKWTWLPLYLFLIFAAWRSLGWRNLIWFLLSVATAITLADQLSVHLFKETVQRLRPCHCEAIAHLVHLPSGRCGGAYGFVSSHAANAFAVAVLVSLLMRRGWVLVTVSLWAALVAYSRIYMGVHYPGDVICGAVFGLLVGLLVYVLVRYVYKRMSPHRWRDRKIPLF